MGSHICQNIEEAREELIRLRSHVCELAESNGLRVVAASTHPFSSWKTQDVTDKDRYTDVRGYAVVGLGWLGEKAAIPRLVRLLAEEPEINFLNITAMLDIMTIILVFLLKSLGETTASVPHST